MNAHNHVGSGMNAEDAINRVPTARSSVYITVKSGRVENHGQGAVWHSCLKNIPRHVRSIACIVCHTPPKNPEKKSPKNESGGTGIRTPDLLHAMQAL